MKQVGIISIFSLISCFGSVSSSLDKNSEIRVDQPSSSVDNKSGNPSTNSTSTSTTTSTTLTTLTSTTSSSTSSSSSTSTSTSSTTSTTIEKTITFNQFKKVITDHCIVCHVDGGQANTMEFNNIQGFLDAQYILKGQWESSPLLYRSKFYEDDPDSDPGRVSGASQDMPRRNNTYDEDDYKLLKQFILEL